MSFCVVQTAYHQTYEVHMLENPKYNYQRGKRFINKTVISKFQSARENNFYLDVSS